MSQIATVKELQSEIRSLLKEKNAILLAHNYQRDEIQEIADFSGDSLELSIKASETDARIILFCGVHFMAETAAIISPDKTVLLPRLAAGCALAAQISPTDIKRAREKYGPDVPVATYMNTTAAVKAESDICFTSANGAQVVRSLNAERVFVAPDKNLANWIQRALPDVEIIAWQGGCPVHQIINPADIIRLKAAWDGAEVIAHPECSPDTLDVADHVTSTSGMFRYAASSSAKRFIICTENGVLYKLRRDNPDKEFKLGSEFMVCPNMKMTSLEDARDALTMMKEVITIPEDIRERAFKAVSRMISIPRSERGLTARA